MNRREAVGRGCFVLYLKRILKGLLVLATIVCVLTLAWQYVYYPDNYDANRVSGFYQEPEKSLDVVLIGASDIGRAYCAGLAYRDYGIRSYPFVINGDDVHVWKYQLSEVLAHQKPDKIVIEVNGALYSVESPKAPDGAGISALFRQLRKCPESLLATVCESRGLAGRSSVRFLQDSDEPDEI